MSPNAITPDGWLKTGDVAVRDNAGYYYIVDRRKEATKCKVRITSSGFLLTDSLVDHIRNSRVLLSPLYGNRIDLVLPVRPAVLENALPIHLPQLVLDLLLSPRLAADPFSTLSPRLYVIAFRPVLLLTHFRFCPAHRKYMIAVFRHASMLTSLRLCPAHRLAVWIPRCALVLGSTLLQWFPECWT